MVIRIRVYENGAYQDEDAAYTLAGEFSPAEALAHCRAMVDADLKEAYVPDISVEALLSAYRMFGRDPVVLGDDGPPFSAWTYAKARAAQMVDGAGKDFD